MDHAVVDIVTSELIFLVEKLEPYVWVKSLVLSVVGKLPDFDQLPEQQQYAQVHAALSQIGISFTQPKDYRQSSANLNSDDVRSKCGGNIKDHRTAEKRDYAKMATGEDASADDESVEGVDNDMGSDYEDEGDDSQTDPDGESEIED